MTLVGLAACDTRANEWTASVYPNANNPALAVTMQGFSSFEQCQEAAIGMLRSFEKPDEGGYSCGRMCRWDPLMRSNVCKEIRR